MTIIIPMAGLGERFLKKGYTVPKPLIEINGIPMVIKATLDLPASGHHIFIALKKHLQEYQVETHIKKHLPDAGIISLDHVTEGQACTCMLALDAIRDDEDILIGACDNGMIINKNTFNEIKATADVIVFSFRNNITVVNKPQQYGWINLDKDGNVKNISVKKPISETPINDHAVVGAFWFRQNIFFRKSTEKMIAENRRINNEFYVDESINDAIALGYKVKVFEIDRYICWGTPDDYSTYKYWQSFFNN